MALLIWERQSEMRIILRYLTTIIAYCCWTSPLIAQGVGAEVRLEERARREFNSGDYAAATHDFAELTKRNPADIFSQIMLGMALFRQEKYADSVPSYEKALALE